LVPIGWPNREQVICVQRAHSPEFDQRTSKLAVHQIWFDLGPIAHAIGVVQSLRAEKLQRTTIYFPVIQFTTAGGETVTAESKTSKSGLFVGQKIPMVYDPSDPTNLEINSFWSRWVLVWIAAFFAVLLLGSGAAAVVALATSVGR